MARPAPVTGLGWPGTAAHLGFAVGMLGVAAFAHAPWVEGVPFVASEDLLHSVFASVVGFGFIAGVLAVTLARRPFSWRRAVPDLLALGVAMVVPLMMSAPVWGLLQRLMFLVAALWYAREAVLATSRAARPEGVVGCADG